MLLEIHDWKFDVDLAGTMAYSAKEAAEHCDCAYCRNFYEAVDRTYPELRPFLARFGVDIEAPEELMPFEPTTVVCCYAVQGRILQFGQNMTHIHGITIYGETPEDAMINAGCEAPYFILSVGPMELPWVLKEEIGEVVSPANRPGFLKRMVNWLMGRGKGSDFVS